MCQLAATWGLSFRAAVFTDSSAALAISQRQGCGKLRHVRIGHLWIQEAQSAGSIACHKVSGTDNPADLMTKHLPAPKMRPLVSRLRQYVISGSAEKRLQLRVMRNAYSRWGLEVPVNTDSPMPALSDRLQAGLRSEEGCKSEHRPRPRTEPDRHGATHGGASHASHFGSRPKTTDSVVQACIS